MTLEDKERAAAIAPIRERAGLDAAAGQERGRCANSRCRKPLPFGQVYCLRCSLGNIRRVN